MSAIVNHIAAIKRARVAQKGIRCESTEGSDMGEVSGIDFDQYDRQYDGDTQGKYVIW